MVVVYAVAVVVIEAALIARALALLPRAREGSCPTPGTRTRELYLYEAAFLAGGPVRVIDVAVLRMHESGRAHISSTGIVTLPDGTVPEDDVESAIVRTAREVSARRTLTVGRLRLRAIDTPEMRRIRDELVADGHIVAAKDPVRRAYARYLYAALLVAIPLGAVLVVGFPTAVGLALYLASVIVPLALLNIGGPRRRSPTGTRELRRLKSANPWALSPETAMVGAVALGGLSAIESEPLRRAMSGTPQSGGSDGGSSGGDGGGCSSGCGGGGCGGGGCGGGGGGCGG